MKLDFLQIFFDINPNWRITSLNIKVRRIGLLGISVFFLAKTIYPKKKRSITYKPQEPPRPAPFEKEGFALATEKIEDLASLKTAATMITEASVHEITYKQCATLICAFDSYYVLTQKKHKAEELEVQMKILCWHYIKPLHLDTITEIDKLTRQNVLEYLDIPKSWNADLILYRELFTVD